MVSGRNSAPLGAGGIGGGGGAQLGTLALLVTVVAAQRLRLQINVLD